MAASQTAKKAVREPVRADVRADPRSTPGEFRGRNGEILRFRSSGTEALEIPEDLKEDGWTYQWQAVTVYGEPSHDLAQMYAHGWRYVTADSRVGQYFVLPGENANQVERGGLVLMERPKQLTQMYINETNERTAAQYAQLMDKSADIALPSGFDNRGKSVRRDRELVSSDDTSIPDED